MGINNYTLGLLSAAHGLYGYLPLSFPYLLMWVVYHASVKTNNFYAKNLQRKCGVICKCLNHFCLLGGNMLTFYYAAEANINIGVISGLFTTAIIYTAIMFRCIYGEKIRYATLSGMLVICGGVICISLDKAETKPYESNKELDGFNLGMAVFFANFSGIAFATNALVMKYFV
jgi:drug/metabolite transporter (DMT)-like permease